MSWEAWGDNEFGDDGRCSEARVEEAFVDGLQACRETMARFVEQGGDDATAASIRANWNPAWGLDPGPITGDIPIDAWGAIAKATTDAKALADANKGD